MPSTFGLLSVSCRVALRSRLRRDHDRCPLAIECACPCHTIGAELLGRRYGFGQESRVLFPGPRKNPDALYRVKGGGVRKAPLEAVS